MKKAFHQDVYIGLFCLAFSLMVFGLNMHLPADAAMVPRLLAGMLTVLSLFIVFQGMRKSKLPVEEQGEKPISVDAIKIPLITWGLVALYFILFVLIGYFASTGIMLIVFMRFMKRSSWKVCIIIAAVYILLIYIIFVRLLSVSVDGFGLLGQLIN